MFRAAGAGCFLAFLACSSSNSNTGFPGDGGTGGTSGGSGGSSGGSGTGGSSGGSGGSSGGSSGGGSSSGSSSSATSSGSGVTGGLGCSSSSPSGAITLDDSTCSWTGGCAGDMGTPAKNTVVLAAASASYANKLNPTCSVCPTSPTADEPTGCPMYTTPATVPARFVSGVGFDSTYDLGATQNQPVYIPNDVIIPTLDDAPDGADPNTGPAGNDGYTPGEWTITDLAFLDSIGHELDFFMNDNNWVTVTTNPADGTCDPDGYDAYVDILTNHFPANHTADHAQMGCNFQGATTCFQ